MLRLLCRAAPVEWRNEQNYTLRRRGARENRMTSLNDRYFTNLTIEHDVFLEGLTIKTADVWVIGSEVGLWIIELELGTTFQRSESWSKKHALNGGMGYDKYIYPLVNIQKTMENYHF